MWLRASSSARSSTRSTRRPTSASSGTAEGGGESHRLLRTRLRGADRAEHRELGPAQRTVEGIEDEAQLLERDDAEQGDITSLAQDHRRVAVAFRHLDAAFRDRSFDRAAVSHHEAHSSLWRKAKSGPHVARSPLGPVMVPSID